MLETTLDVPTTIKQIVSIPCLSRSESLSDDGNADDGSKQSLGLPTHLLYNTIIK